MVSLFLVAGLIYDWRTRGRPHPAYLVGLAALIGTGAGFSVLSVTPGWIHGVGRLPGQYTTALLRRCAVRQVRRTDAGVRAR